MVSDPRQLFVYGTLMRGERNHALMEGSRYLGEVATFPGFELRDLQLYPGMVKGAGGSVQGELYAVDVRILAELDELEGHPHHFWRTTIRLVDRRPTLAYLLREEHAHGAPRIESGDWRRR